MASLEDIPELVGFFSYSRSDDKNALGSLSELREAIQRELCLQLGRTSPEELRLWQDKEAIPPGDLWQLEIKAAIGQAVFFVPIVTPLALKSPHCRTEFEAFLERQRSLGRTDLVFPILYVAVPELEDERRWGDDPVLSVIGARQWVDWRPLRQREIGDLKVRQTVEFLVTKIVEKLRASTSVVPSPLPERAARNEAELRTIAEEVQRKQGTEARHREAAAEAERQRLEREAAGEAERPTAAAQSSQAQPQDDLAKLYRDGNAPPIRLAGGLIGVSIFLTFVCSIFGIDSHQNPLLYWGLWSLLLAGIGSYINVRLHKHKKRRWSVALEVVFAVVIWLVFFLGLIILLEVVTAYFRK